MDPQRWQQARALFDKAAELPEEQWDAFLQAHCSDADVRAEARALLQADRAASATLGLAERSPDLLEAAAEAQARAHADILVGTRFGAWRLVRLLGQGGMGAVYLAERIEGGFSQQAALKLMQPGVGGHDLLARFRTERQILAGLTHPNIARLLDGGAGPGGQPYLALEYVDGTDLRSHCDAHGLDVAQRVDLFLTVCDAVAHAHARLVVHRDLKPANLLVTPEGEVKLLDFGIAKLLDDAAPAEATAARLRRYTPSYAAPEQIRGEPTTTAVDVHALGALLFELLTGQRPFGGDGSSAAGVESAVLHSEAPRPSSVVTRRAEEVPRLAPRQRAQLRSTLRGDLDQIVLRALRKQPEQRYASVRDLADDLRAWREHRPVQARRGSTRYRLGRFLRRHAVASGFALLALLALIAGLGGALWQAQIAREQRDMAQREADKARAALDFMTGIFSRADPEVSQGREVSARELLAQGATRIRGELQDQPAARAELLRAIGDAYLGLGLYEEALPLLDEAGAALVGDADTVLSRAIARHELGRYAEALALLEPEYARLEAIAPSGSPQQALVDLRLAMAYQALNRLDDADRAYTRVLEYQRRALGADHVDTRETELRYVSLLVLSNRHEDAKWLSGGLLAALRARADVDPTLLARAIGAHAMVLSNTGPLEQAEALRREQLALNERVLGATHPRTVGTRNDLAAALFAQQRNAEAAILFAEVLDARRAHYGPDHPVVATAANNLANAWLALDQPERARPAAEDALRIRLAHYGENHHTTAASLRAVAGVEMDLGRMQRARALLERAVASFAAALGPEHRIGVGSINDLVRVRLALRDPDPGCELARRALRLSQAEAKPQTPEANYQFALLAACRLALGDADARVDLERAHAVVRAGYGEGDRRERAIARLLP